MGPGWCVQQTNFRWWDQDDVSGKLTSEDSENDSFPKLKGCDGFELLQCTANGRDLNML